MLAPNLNPTYSASAFGVLGKKFLMVFLILVVYRVGTYIPLPSVDSAALSETFNGHVGGILGMFNMFTGGALGRMSIFALNIMPYITASIVMQLLSAVSPSLANLKKEGESGRKKVNQYTRYLTILLSIFQGYGVVVGIGNAGVSVQGISSAYLIFVSIITLTAGTVFLMWLGDCITHQGLGNGASFIIFTGIVAELPSALVSLFEMGKVGSLSFFVLILLLVMMACIIGFIVLMEKAQRRLPVQYPRRQVGNKIFGGEFTHLPLKLNVSGVISPIFASAILLFPTTIISFLGYNNDSAIHQFIASNMVHGKILYMLLYLACIVFFCFFYTSIVFNPVETADNLKKAGAVILGRRPGKNTADYLDHVLTRITIIGAGYIACVCIIPELIMSRYSVPFYLSGTSLLIVVNVVIELFTNVQTHIISNQYHGLLKNNKMIKRV